jgi:hypothetical protein
MKLGIFIEGDYPPSLVVETIIEQGADLHVFPVEYGLGLPNAYPVALDEGYGADAPGERVFRILNKADALLVFAEQTERGVIHLAVKKAFNYSMPVTIVRLEDDKPICDTTGPKQAAGAVGRQERISARRRRESKIAAAGSVQAAAVTSA